MPTPKATGTYVYIIRDEVQKKVNELLIPGKGRVKPHQGVIFSIGGKVTDSDIKKSKGEKAIFHSGVGQEVEIEGVIYLVLQEHEIIGIVV
jgi:co-chaperonin GroES (HSP10)